MQLEEKRIHIIYTVVFILIENVAQCSFVRSDFIWPTSKKIALFACGPLVNKEYPIERCR